jgi:hypothetical protein
MGTKELTALRASAKSTNLVESECAVAQVAVFENNDFQGRSYTTQQQDSNFARSGFNYRTSSIVVKGERWEVCEEARFRGLTW